MQLKRDAIAGAIRGLGRFKHDRLCIRPLLCNFPKDEAGNASLDLHLGRWFLTLQETEQTLLDFSKRTSGTDVDISRKHFIRFDDIFVLHPGRFVLGATLEWVRLPTICSGSIVGKSSLGRHGLVIETSPVVHPAFSGCLTLELANVGEVPIALRPGMEVAQLQIYLAQGKGGARSRFNGYRRPTLGAISLDPTIKRLQRSQAFPLSTKNSNSASTRG